MAAVGECPWPFVAKGAAAGAAGSTSEERSHLLERDALLLKHLQNMKASRLGQIQPLYKVFEALCTK